MVDIARRHRVIANQLSDWRRQVRDGILVLPFAATTTSLEHDGIEPAFVPLAIAAEADLRRAADAGFDVEIGSDAVMRVPNDVAVEWLASLVRAVRGAA